MPDADRMLEVELMADRMNIPVSLSASVRDRALFLENLGFGGLDALHLAVAEKAKADIFLTTDDALLKRVRRYQGKISVEADNPLRWFERMVSK